MKKQKILIIRFSSIGDILLTSAFVRQTRMRFPDAEIIYLTKVQFADLLRFNPNIDTLIEYDSITGIKGLAAIRKKLKTNEISHVFDLHNNLRSHQLTRGLKADYIKRFRKRKIRRALLVYFKINTYKTITTVAERYLDVGRAAGVEDDDKGLQLVWDKAVEKSVDTLAEKVGLTGPFIAIAPGAAHYTKTWPHDYLTKLIEKLTQRIKMPIVLLGSEKERDRFKPLAKNKAVHNMAGKLSLLQSAALLKRAQLLLSNDSGLMHMATAVDTNLIAIFGSTVKELGFFPFRSRHTVLEEPLWCRPCSHVGRSKCPLGHFKCMREITPDIVYNEISRQLRL